MTAFEPILLESLATNIVYVALGGVLLIFPIGIIWGRLRPDPKPPLGDYESFAGLVLGKGHESWGRLSLSGGILRFAPHEGEALEWPVSAMNHAVFGWPSSKFSISLAAQRLEFDCFQPSEPFRAQGGTSNAGPVRKEWRRQLAAAGVRVLEIEPEGATNRASLP